MSRKSLHSTAISSGLLDAAGNPIPAAPRVDIRDLPMIDPAALPGLPDDVEARLAPGDPPMIVLWQPGSELHIEMPLTDMDEAARYAEALLAARSRQAMGEAPEDGGYRVANPTPKLLP